MGRFVGVRSAHRREAPVQRACGAGGPGAEDPRCRGPAAYVTWKLAGTGGQGPWRRG